MSGAGSGNRDRRQARPWRAGPAVLCGLLLGLAAAPARAQFEEPAAVRMAGPLAAREMVEALAAEFARTGVPVAPEYLRVDVPAAAAGALLSGRDMVLCLGPLAERDLGPLRERWRALAAPEHVIAGRAVAIVVHERSAVESLTLEQLQTLFAPGTRDWSALGGSRAAIRRYGPGLADPLTAMFHEKVLSAGRCGPIMRKNQSAEVLAALGGDPDGIAFVDAVAAASARETVRLVPLGPARAAVAPNAQTIKEGVYPLAQTLVLYVSPQASEAARGFARFLLDGGGDAVIRRHGFLPTLRAASADVLAAFEKLYGPDIQRVRATPEAADDLALAVRIIQSARTSKLDAELLAAMCEAAYELAAGVPGGHTTAFEALGVLAERVPQQGFGCALKRAALCEQVYQAGGSPADGVHLVEALMAAGELGTASRRFGEAADAWRRAQAVADEINAPAHALIEQRRPAFEARRQSVAEAAALAGRLRQAPDDVEARARLFWVQLVELDDPAEAARYIDVIRNEEAQACVPLACQPLERLSAEAALKLAEWYVGLLEHASAGGQELLGARARACYGRFFAQHIDHEDALAMRAALGLRKVGGQPPDPSAAQAHSGRAPPVTAGLVKGGAKPWRGAGGAIP